MSSFKNIFLNKILKYFKPIMIYGYKRFDGVKLKQTRIGNTVILEGENKLYIEDNVFIGHYTFLDASNGLTIEEGCQVTNFISILTHSSHNSIRYYGSEYRKHKDHKGYVRGSVRIGKYTFIGPHSTIMPNTDIGKGCIITAYSFVKGSFPDFSIISGNPAKVVGDTRKKDDDFLRNDSDLRIKYDNWAK